MNTAEELYNLVYHHCVTKYDPQAGIRACDAFERKIRAEGEEAQSKAADDAATFCIEHLAKMLGNPDYVHSDGSEEWEGDVAGTINNVLETARVLDPWDWAVARHAVLHEERPDHQTGEAEGDGEPSVPCPVHPDQTDCCLMYDNGWAQVGWYREKLEQAERDRETWKDRAMALKTATRDHQTGEVEPVADKDYCDKCDDSGFVIELGRQEYCDCACGHDAQDQDECKGMHAPKPVADGVEHGVRGREHALELLDDVDSLVRFCSVSMPDVDRYNRGGESFWKVVHWIAAMPKAADAIMALYPRPSDRALVEALKYARNLIGPDEIVDAALATHAAKE